MESASDKNSDRQRWLDRVIPLPKEMAIAGSVRLPAAALDLHAPSLGQPPLRQAIDLLGPLAQAAEGRGTFTIRLALLECAADLPQDLCRRLRSLPNAGQAYAIAPLPADEGLLLLATSPLGLLYAARTLHQLIRPPCPVRPETEIELPLVNVVDWPDLEERGQWGGNVASDLAWTSQWKLNVVEIWAEAGVDPDGQPAVHIRRDLFRRGAELGVKIVPYILHLEQVSRYAGLMDRQDLISTPDPSKPLPSDYTPGLCMSSPATQELVGAWLARTAEIEGVTDIMVWLSEGAAPCYCPRCLGQEPFGLEVACILRAFAQVRAGHPGLRLRLLTTQGSYPVNDKILAAIPEGVGVTYYDGGRTYDSSHQPMIYPLLEGHARAGHWLGVYPQITHCWRTVFPWTAPQFLQYRAGEFAAKGLRCVIGYAVPSNRYHEFNVMALAEWSWNASGRSPAAFARAYATAAGMADPDLYARWALLAGEAGWALAESRLFLTLIYDPSVGSASAPFDHRFENASLQDPAAMHGALATARAALALAREAADPDMVGESECVLAGLEAFATVRAAKGLLAAPALSAGDRPALAEALEQLDRCAYIVRTRLFEWGERVCSRSGEKTNGRLADTATALLRACDALRREALGLGVDDPRPAYRLRQVGGWSAEDFQQSQRSLLSIDVTQAVPLEGGSYHVGFDFTDSAWGVEVRSVRLLLRSPGRESYSILAETPDRSGGYAEGIGIYSRWGEVRLAVPSRPADAHLALGIELFGMPPDAPDGRRTCSGTVGLRRVWERCDAPWEAPRASSAASR